MSISIHALREEGDRSHYAQIESGDKFLSTPSARRATRSPRDGAEPQEISIHALREEGDFHTPATARPSRLISIHALREEGDYIAFDHNKVKKEISIHALREEGDGGTKKPNAAAKRFLSTPSARRATQSYERHGKVLLHFYPRPPRGGRLDVHDRGNAQNLISIHALREEGDALRMPTCFLRKRFLSTPSARRATNTKGCLRLTGPNFYPRPPRGGRLIIMLISGDTAGFLSTPSARRATGKPSRRLTRRANFYPRPPRGGRPQGPLYVRQHWDFYPRPPRGGRPHSRRP